MDASREGRTETGSAGFLIHATGTARRKNGRDPAPGAAAPRPRSRYFTGPCPHPAGGAGALSDPRAGA